MSLLPASKPRATRDEIEARIALFRRRLPETDRVLLVMIRGYYRDSMGAPGKNDVGLYDDAAFWLGPDGTFAPFNANTDPSRLGWNPRAGKYMARLQPGLWRFQKWKHKGEYWAFGQASRPVTVDRVREDGTVAKTETGVFGINLHMGGVHGTSSEGCLTIPRQHNQWLAFSALGFTLLGQSGQKDFPLILITNPDAA